MTPGATLRWQVVVDGALEGALNMARDHATALAVGELPRGGQGWGVLRFYRWRAPTLSLGRNEPGRDRFDPAELSRAGVEVVRRPTGGRAVLHHHELTYSVCLPLRRIGGVRAAYHAVNRGLVAGLQALGAPVALAGDTATALPPDAGPCFRSPAPGEVTADGRKLVGSAQARIGAALLQHGSILLHDDQGRIAALAAEGSGTASDGVSPGGISGASAGRAAALDELFDRPPPVRLLTQALTDGLARELGGDWTPAAAAPTLLPSSTAAAAEEEWLAHYRSTSWTWRR